MKTSIEQLEALKRGRQSSDKRERCGRCAGTGQFITRIENGQPTGPGGICYRCAGKGFQTDADRRRNWGYDMNRRIDY